MPGASDVDNTNPEYVGRSFFDIDMSPLRRARTTSTRQSESELPPVPRTSIFSKLILIFKSMYTTTFTSKFISPTSSESPSLSTPTINYIARISFFFVLELAFIILSAVSLGQPLPIDSSPSTQDNVKGGYTVLFIIWQTIAIVPLQHTVLCLFSHEWSIQWTQLQVLHPDLTLEHPNPNPNTRSSDIDAVSTLPSSLHEQIQHLKRRRASKIFKLAFATSITLLGLAKLGPGAIGVALVRRDKQVDINIGQIRMITRSPTDLNTVMALQRAQTIVRLEHLGRSLHGFNVQPNRIVGWPPIDFKNEGIEALYPSDVIEFKSSCDWVLPSFAEERNIIIGGGERWTYAQIPPEISRDGGIIPIFSLSDTPFSAYLFYGSNDTFGTTSTSRYIFNLENIPALFNQTGINDPRFPIQLNSPLLSMLICNPQPRISGGSVRLHINGTLTVDDSKTDSPSPRIANFPSSSVNILFSLGLLATTQTIDTRVEGSTASFNFITNRIFLNQPDIKSPSAINRLLPIEIIQSNMDLILLSASKAFADGYYSPENNNSGSENENLNGFDTIPVRGTIREEVLALTGSTPLVVITIALSILTMVLATALFVNAPDQLELFNLESVLRKLGNEASETSPST